MGSAHGKYADHLQHVCVVKHRMARSSLHIPLQVPPVMTKLIDLIICYCKSAGPVGRILSATLLLGYSTLGKLPGNASQSCDLCHTIKCVYVLDTGSQLWGPDMVIENHDVRHRCLHYLSLVSC